MIDPYTDFINFGKYSGMLYDDVTEIEPSYIVWIDENVKTVKLPKDYVEVGTTPKQLGFSFLVIK